MGGGSSKCTKTDCMKYVKECPTNNNANRINDGTEFSLVNVGFNMYWHWGTSIVTLVLVCACWALSIWWLRRRHRRQIAEITGVKPPKPKYQYGAKYHHSPGALPYTNIYRSPGPAYVPHKYALDQPLDSERFEDLGPVYSPRRGTRITSSRRSTAAASLPVASASDKPQQANLGIVETQA